MPVMSLWKRPLLTITFALFVAAHAKEPAASKPTLVEVWRGGDDGLTLRLTDAIENALGSSSDFVPSYGKKPGTLIVLIPTHVKWEHVGKRTKVFCTVEFSTVGGHKISTIKGWCWDREYAKCVAKVMKAARSAARKIHEDEQKGK